MGTLPKERGGLRTKGLRVRGIEIGSDDGAAAGSTTTKGAGLTVQEGSPYSESRIQFEFGSARLTPYAREVLDVFAKAIASPGLADRSFVVEGHTDGVGSDQFNLRLSRERADAVVDYLVSAWKADPGRFVTRGKGMRELLEKNDPRAASNRRVVWVALP
jgi:outer membrane protein OmpA-like peptidoglycan-associated protein